MNRKIRVIVIILALVALFGVYVVYTNRHLSDEMPYRTAAYHTIGTVTLVVDGEERAVNNIPLRYIGAKTEDTTVYDNRFRIKRGDSGDTLFRFNLNPVIGQDIGIEAYHYNSSWWYVNEMSLRIDVTTQPQLTASMSGVIQTQSKDGLFQTGEFSVPEKVITPEDYWLSARNVPQREPAAS